VANRHVAEARVLAKKGRQKLVTLMRDRRRKRRGNEAGGMTWDDVASRGHGDSEVVTRVREIKMRARLGVRRGGMTFAQRVHEQ
jgi:hypothetical protein